MIQLIKGFKDILPGEVELWQYVENQARNVFENFGFKEIRVPIMEKTELFARSIGEDTDIVEKEMYTFADRGKDMITLRPEATASVVRSYIQHKMYAQDPIRKFYTIGPMFRRERPQKGRYRQFYQINAEVFGVSEPYIDAQLIYMLVQLFTRLKVTGCQALINSLGCPACRPNFKAALSAFIDQKKEALCQDCERRRTRNPLRVLDCKVPACREAMEDAPSIIEHLCPECESHFETVKQGLDRLKVNYTIDKRLVRGLDYYTRTTFEIQTTALGAQSAVAGGGRYDGLIKTLGGPDQPAIGFAIGFDRLVEIIEVLQQNFVQTPDIYIAALGQSAIDKAFEWTCELNQSGVRVETDFGNKSLKSQMKRADRLNARYVLILGEDEIQQGSAILRDMATKEQQTISIANIIEELKATILERS